MYSRTNKKMLQENCKRLRSQINELEERLRSSSLSRMVESAKEKSIVEERPKDQRKKIEQEYQRAMEKLVRDFQDNKQRLRRDYEYRLAQLDRRTVVNKSSVRSTMKENTQIDAKLPPRHVNSVKKEDIGRTPKSILKPSSINLCYDSSDEDSPRNRYRHAPRAY